MPRGNVEFVEKLRADWGRGHTGVRHGGGGVMGCVPKAADAEKAGDTGRAWSRRTFSAWDKN